MILANTSEKLSKLGLPKVWQLLVLIHILLSVYFTFRGSDLLLNINNIFLASLSFVGISLGIHHHKHPTNPWGFLLVGAGFVSSSIILSSLNYFDLKIPHMAIVGIEEIGLIAISIFTFMFILQIDKKNNTQGFSTDYTLVAISISIFSLLLSPHFFSSLVNEMGFIQQLDILNLFAATLFLSMIIFNRLFNKRDFARNSIRMIMIFCLGAHFAVKIINSFDLTISNSLLSQATWSFYHFAGAFAIIFVFTEKNSSQTNTQSNPQIGSQYMWGASIVTIIAIPLAIIIRDRLGYQAIAPITIGTVSFLLSSIVIWRVQVLVKHIDQQRKTLRTIAYVDPLTKLPNYHGYLDQLSSININNVFVLSVNIEDFKSINDLYGRDFGDEVLKSLAKRIKMLPGNILVARTGADYFHAVFRTKVKDIQTLVDEVQLHLGVWDIVQKNRIAVPLTYGASHSSSGCIKPETLAQQAEKALKVSRQEHTNFTLFTEQSKHQKRSLPRHELREILQKAVDDNHLPVHFQPIYDLESGDLKALELLIRVDSEEHGLLMPGQFLDQAKAYGLLTPLTEVCIHMVAKSYEQLPDVTININMPPYMLNSAKVLNNFIESFDKAKLPKEQFCIEITEDGDIPTDHLIPSIKQLKSQGFKIAMDDFGTGYSSLSRLTVLPVDVVKIDRSLLLAASAGDKTILESAITLTKRLGASTVVEGVETLEQLALIKALGADSVQGFLFSKPVKISKVPLLALNANNIVSNFSPT